MKKQILTLMVGAAVFAVSPTFAMDPDLKEDCPATSHRLLLETSGWGVPSEQTTVTSLHHSQDYVYCSMASTIFSNAAASIPAIVESHPFEHPNTWNNPEITKILKEAKILKVEPMKQFLMDNGKKVEFSGDVFLATLVGGIRAVFKSLPLDDQGDAHAEVAAYNASLFLGFPYVPPTVLRCVNGMKGSMQLFVKTSNDLLAESEYEKAIKEVSLEDNANLRLFYFIFGQWDSGRHNLLVYKDSRKTYLIAIDNSGIRNHQKVKFGDVPFVRILYSDDLNTKDWDKPFNFENAKTIEKPSAENLRMVFQQKLPDSFYNTFNSYDEPLRYVVYKNSLWRQYHAFDQKFVRAHADHCPHKTREVLQKLELKALKKIYTLKNVSKLDFLNTSYYEDILDRRDQVLRYFDEHKGSS